MNVARPITPAALVAHAEARLASLLKQAADFRAAAEREADRPTKPWPGMIDTLFRESFGVHELGTLAAMAGWYAEADEIHAAVIRTAQQLIDLSSRSRLGPFPGRAPAAPELSA